MPRLSRWQSGTLVLPSGSLSSQQSILLIGGGTSEILKLVIAKEVSAGHA